MPLNRTIIFFTGGYFRANINLLITCVLHTLYVVVCVISFAKFAVDVCAGALVTLFTGSKIRNYNQGKYNLFHGVYFITKI